MRDIDTVLAATDFSDCAQTALHAAADATKLYEARLVVAHVLQNLDHTYSLLIDNVEEEEEQTAEANLDKALDELRISRTNTDSVVSRGSPVEGLIRIALREHADVLVAGLMGSTGCGEAGTLGSVVDRLLRAGLFDLYLVRPDETPGLQKVAVATDFSDSADIALRRAVDLARRSSLTEVTVIHAFDLPQGYSKLNLGEAEAERHVLENIDEMFEDMVGRVVECGGLTLLKKFVRGSAPDAIRSACVEGGVDLLVLGAEGRTAAAAALIGNVALKIAQDAPCSVWVSRPAGHTLTFGDALKRLMGIPE